MTQNGIAMNDDVESDEALLMERAERAAQLSEQLADPISRAWCRQTATLLCDIRHASRDRLTESELQDMLLRLDQIDRGE